MPDHVIEHLAAELIREFENSEPDDDDDYDVPDEDDLRGRLEKIEGVLAEMLDQPHAPRHDLVTKYGIGT